MKKTIPLGLGLLILIGVLALPALAQQAAIAATPPMGWNSWNHFGCHVTDEVVRKAADALVSSGMKQAGYLYVNVDDCWEGDRDTKGVIHSNQKFPDMKALGDYIHSRGLKFGLYSSPGPHTCAGFDASWKHEQQDAAQYAAWGVDYLKYDWCSADHVYMDEQMPEAYKKMHDALNATGRPIVFSLCQYGIGAVWRWGRAAGGNLWRTTDDISDSYSRMSEIGFSQNGLEQYAGPGHWNDPDMLEIGNGKMSHDEYRTQMSLWCMLAAPLLAGNDLTKMEPIDLAILINPEVIAVDQDPKGIQGHRIWEQGPYEIWAKLLGDGSTAVAFFNRGEGMMGHKDQLTLQLKDIGVFGSGNVRDLWEQKDLGRFTGAFTAEVPAHGVVMVKVH